jgi:glycosyltransferase involved in cell wall biosynthesis
VKDKKVLIITYYWPPGGGAGVQRWLKFVKYLPFYKWNPVVYTPANGEMPVKDLSLQNDVPANTEVIRRPIWEPYSLYKKFIGARKNETINTGFLTERKKAGLAVKISVWLRGNLFIPDARCFWIRPSVNFLTKYLRSNPVDVIVSTGPPHSMHLIAMKLSEKLSIPWIADFRDPWTNIDYYEDLLLTPLADKLHRQLEKKVLEKADRVIVIGETMKKEFELLAGRNIDLISNGYDDENIIGLQPQSRDKFIIAHVGTLVRTRNPTALWDAIAVLVESNIAFAGKLEIRLVGKTDFSVKESIEANGLSEYVKYIDYLPHDEVILQQLQASLLLLILNNTPNANGIITGKLYEYLSARRPVLCIGPPNGDAAKILHETGSGNTIAFEDELGIKQQLQQYFSDFVGGKQLIKDIDISMYSRKELTHKLSLILDEVIESHSA